MIKDGIEHFWMQSNGVPFQIRSASPLNDFMRLQTGTYKVVHIREGEMIAVPMCDERVGIPVRPLRDSKLRVDYSEVN